MTIVTSLKHAHTSLQLCLVRAIHKMCTISSYSRIDKFMSKDAVFIFKKVFYLFMVVDAVLFIYFWIQPPLPPMGVQASERPCDKCP